MIKNYLKIAFRNLKKNKVFSFINLAGLAVGIACSVLILLWIQDELSFDRFHENAKYLYREVNHEEYPDGESVDFAQSPYGLAPVLKDEFPEIVDVTRVRSNQEVIITKKETTYNEKGFFFVDANFFEVFSFPLLIGEKATVLANPNSIVLTEEMASKYFGKMNPIGQKISVNNKLHFFVTGIAKNPPANNHLDFNFLVSIENVKNYYASFDEWNSWAFTNYVLLDKKADYKLVGSKISDVIKNHNEDAIATVGLQPITKIHLYSRNIWGYGGDGDIVYVRIFAIIAFFVLLTACINFMNLSTARSNLRAREVGLRKAIGSSKKTLISQFFGESVFMSVISMLIAVGIVLVLLPFFNDIAGKHIRFNIFQNGNIILLLVGTTLFAGIVAGIYPALFLSSFQPIKVLKGTYIPGSKGTLFRRILVLVQFSLTIALIIASLVVTRQLHFVRTQKMGFDTEQIATIRLKGDLKAKTKLLKSELMRNDGISSVCAASSLPLDISASYIINNWDGKIEGNQFLSFMLSVDDDFLNLFKIDMAEGRFFSKDFPTDSTAMIINQAAMENLGWNNFEGKECMGRKVIGVMKNFNFKSLHNKIGPLTITSNNNNFDYLFVKFNAGNLVQSVKKLEADWGNIASAYPFELTFMDDHINQLYLSDQRVEKIINVFTFLLLFIASLGLFGLSLFTAEQKIKENGIRKILGSSVSGILFQLSGEFVKWVAIANLIAWPIAYLFMKKWLETFAYKTPLSWWIFALAGLLALGIALLTVSWQSWRAATRNPVEALRYE